MTASTYPVFLLASNSKQLKCEQTHCEDAAAFYRVEGASFACFATLCKTHADAAEAEGFWLVEL